MPNRVIKESIKRSPEIDRLTWFEEVVFYRLLVTADDYGCLDGRIIVLKHELFPTKESVTKKSIEDAIAALVSAGLLCPYTVSGMPYLFFPTWEKHQRVRNKHRKYPEPPENCLTAIRGQMTADCQPESNPIQSESNPNRRDGADAPAEAAIFLTLNDNSEYPVTCSQLKEWEALYPAVDVPQELRNMRAWLQANPKRRKTGRGILRFVNGWLAREQDKPHPAVQHVEPKAPDIVPEMVEPTRDMDKHVVQVDPTKPFNLWDLVP